MAPEFCLVRLKLPLLMCWCTFCPGFPVLFQSKCSVSCAHVRTSYEVTVQRLLTFFGAMQRPYPREPLETLYHDLAVLQPNFVTTDGRWLYYRTLGLYCGSTKSLSLRYASGIELYYGHVGFTTDNLGLLRTIWVLPLGTAFVSMQIDYTEHLQGSRRVRLHKGQATGELLRSSPALEIQ